MPRVPLDVATGAYTSSSKRLAAQECVNMFPKVPETSGALNNVALFSAPGVKQVADIGTGPGRGAVVLGRTLYVVSGNGMYEVSDIWDDDLVGTISGTDRCIMVSNGETIAIQVPGGDGYFYDPVNGLVAMSDPSIPGYLTYQSFQAQTGGVLSVSVKDGYFVFITRFEAFLSELVTIDGGRGFLDLTFFTAEIKPDYNVTVATIRNELYVVGQDTIELFQNTGAGDSQPFQRIQSATIDKGLAARHAFIEHLDDFVFMGGGMGERLSIFRGSPGGTVKISTSAIDDILAEATADEVVRSYAFTFQEAGNFFAVFTVGANTMIYDSASSSLIGRPVWHMRESSGSANGEWRVNNSVEAYYQNVVQDSVDGRLGIISRTHDQEYGENIPWRFSGQYLSNQSAPLIINEIEARTQTPNLGTDTQTMKLEVSFDGAATWVDYGSVSVGTTSDKDLRQIWRRIGRVDYQVIFRLSGDNADRTNVLEMYAEAEGGQKWL